MKLNLRVKPGQILSDLFRHFLPSAVICLLLTMLFIADSVISLAANSVISPALVGKEPFGLWRNVFNYSGSALCMSLLFATAASCLCERYQWRRFIAWPAAAAGAAVGALFVWMNPSTIPLGIILCCLALCLHAVSRRDNPSVRIAQVCGWFFVCLGISIVLYFALEFCCMAVFALLLQNVTYQTENIFQNAVLYFSFFLFAPWLFLGGLPKSDMPLDKRIGFRKFAYVVLLPLYLLLLGILLLYIAKIALTLTIPVGVMNGYSIAALTMFVFFHLILDGEENRLSKWFKHWGGLLLAPIVVVQGIAVWMRVSAYGLTEARVLGIVWTLLCVAVVITALCRKRANWFFLTTAVVSVIIFCTPLSARNMAMINQESRLTAALERNNMLDENGKIVANSDISAEDQEIIYSSVDYLEDIENPREGSITAQLHSQTEELAKDSEYSRRTAVIKEELLGFDKPEKADTSWYSRSYRFEGTAVQSKVETRGCAYAEWIDIWQDTSEIQADSTSSDEAIIADKTVPESSDEYCTTDIDALVEFLEASRDSDQPLNFTVPVTFVIDGEEVDLTPLLNGTQLKDGIASLPTDTLTLPSGKKFHIARLRVVNYASESSDDSISLTGWLLTPEE